MWAWFHFIFWVVSSPFINWSFLTPLWLFEHRQLKAVQNQKLQSLCTVSNETKCTCFNWWCHTSPSLKLLYFELSCEACFTTNLDTSALFLLHFPPALFWSNTPLTTRSVLTRWLFLFAPACACVLAPRRPCVCLTRYGTRWRRPTRTWSCGRSGRSSEGCGGTWATRRSRTIWTSTKLRR